MNNVLMIGRVFQDNDIFTTTSGKQYVNLKLAISKGKDDEGKWKNEIFTIFLWENNARYANKWVHKGDLLLIEGHIGIKKEVDNQGKNVYKYYIVGDKMTKLHNAISTNSSNINQSNEKPASIKMDDISKQIELDNLPWEQ